MSEAGRLPTPKRLSLVDQTIDALLALIAQRGLTEDDRLPSTGELADSLDVSRPVVREAIAELAGQGLLRRRQGRETVIALPSAAQVERMLRLRATIRATDMEDLQEFREIIEVAAARLAAARSTAADIAALEAIQAQMVSAAAEDHRHHIDQDFHSEIARIAGNDMLVLTLEGISPVLFDLRRRAWAGWAASGHGVEPLIEAHASILAAIRSRDGAAAAAAMQQHLAQAREGLTVKADLSRSRDR